jgi:uncharacterized membrane protein YkgB
VDIRGLTYANNFYIICTNLLLKLMKIRTLEQKVYTILDKYSDWFLRFSIAIIYIWFGILKPFDSSPAADLVANSIYFLPREPFFIFLGIWETILGIMFLFPKLTKITFWIFILHMGGTFTPFITLTDTVFTTFPYGFSLEGQYIVKNIVLISAAVAILVNHLHKTKELD